MRLSLLVALSLLAGCQNEEANDALWPSLYQIRHDLRQVPDDQSQPILPEVRHIIGVVVNGEEEEDYLAPLPISLLTADQMALLEDLDDPVALEKHAEYAYETAPGDLYDDEGDIFYDDVKQGAIADCYLAAALSGALYADTEHRLRDGLIRPIEDADGNPRHYAVRFYDAWGRPQDVLVDADQVRSGSGNPTYLRSGDSRRGEEEWALGLIEKAYALWHDGYEEIGNGGNAGDVLQALSGAHSTYRSLKYLSDDSLERIMGDAVESSRPMTVCTFGEDDGVDYTGTSIYAWHCYTGLGVRRDESDALLVKLRNPWGSTEPPGNGPDDGIFELGTEELRRLYQGLTIGGGFTADTHAPGEVDDLEVIDTYESHLVIRLTPAGDDGDRGLATRYDLRVSDAPIDSGNFYQATAVGAPSPQAAGTKQLIDIGDLDATKAWYVAIKVEDESGNISPLSNVVSGTPEAPEPVVTETIAAAWDFEGPLGDWSTGGLFHVSDRWSTSPTHAMWMGDDSTGTYDSGGAVDADLTSPLIDLAGLTTPVLRWDQKLTTEPALDRDKAWVEIAGSGDGFDQWVQVYARDATTPLGAKQTIEIDLSPWAGQQIYAFWLFDSVDGIDNDFEGWLIDDVRLVDKN